MQRGKDGGESSQKMKVFPHKKMVGAKKKFKTSCFLSAVYDELFEGEF